MDEKQSENTNKSGGGKQKEEGLEVEGIVVESLKGKFRIQVVKEGEQIDPDNPGMEVLGHLAGKLRKHYIKIVPGDRVKVEVSPYDLTRGRITFRCKK
jgi:translation initiation factor IF-1